MALLALGRIDEAAAAVESFSPVPGGSQWQHINLLISHAVMAHADGPEEAAAAPRPQRPGTRGPATSSDVGPPASVAYIAHVRGDHERVDEITSNTYSFGGSGLWTLLVFTPLGATKENFFDVYDAYRLEHPVAEQLGRDFEHSQRLLVEEVTRWSPTRDDINQT